MEFQEIKKLADEGVEWACGLVRGSYCNGENGLVPSIANCCIMRFDISYQ